MSTNTDNEDDYTPKQFMDTFVQTSLFMIAYLILHKIIDYIRIVNGVPIEHKEIAHIMAFPAIAMYVYIVFKSRHEFSKGIWNFIQDRIAVNFLGVILAYAVCHWSITGLLGIFYSRTGTF